GKLGGVQGGDGGVTRTTESLFLFLWVLVALCIEFLFGFGGGYWVLPFFCLVVRLSIANISRAALCFFQSSYPLLPGEADTEPPFSLFANFASSLFFSPRSLRSSSRSRLRCEKNSLVRQLYRESESETREISSVYAYVRVTRREIFYALDFKLEEFFLYNNNADFTFGRFCLLRCCCVSPRHAAPICLEIARCWVDSALTFIPFRRRDLYYRPLLYVKIIPVESSRKQGRLEGCDY
ncbi:hypothetical protein U1Q18_047319, partial [Sarracenia purpurea var. burkii]